MIRDPWIRVHAQLAERPVVTRMAEALRIDPFKAIGHLVTFWGAVSAHATRGCVTDVPDALLERWAGWTGKRGAFAAWVRDQHVDEDGRISEWDTYQGKLETKRELERDRQRKSRERHADNTSDIRVTSRRRTANHTRDVGTPTRERDGTVRNKDQTQDQKRLPDADAPAPPVSWPAEAAELWTGKVGPVSPGKAGKLLKPLVDLHGWSTVKAGLADYLTATPTARVRLDWFVEKGTYWIELAKQPIVNPDTGFLTERANVIAPPS